MTNPTRAGFFKLTNFTNLTCKTLQKYERFECLIIFCAAVTVTTFLISGFLTYLGLLD